jgi:hypothetical protein
VKAGKCHGVKVKHNFAQGEKLFDVLGDELLINKEI